MQDELWSLFVCMAFCLIALPAFAHFNALTYYVGYCTVVFAGYSAFVAHEAAKVVKSGRNDKDE